MLRDRYLSTHSGAHEKTTLKTAGTHFKHLVATLEVRRAGCLADGIQEWGSKGPWL